MPRTFPAVLLLILAISSPVVSAQWFGSGTVEARHSDNLSRSPLGGQEARDQSLQVGISGGQHSRLADYTGLTLTASLQREEFRRYHGLANQRLGVSATVDHKLGLGERAPLLTLAASVERGVFHGGIRNQWLQTVRVGYQQRLAGTVSVSLTAGHEKQLGDNNVLRAGGRLPGDVWNQKALLASATVEWDTGVASWLTASLQFRNGETAASILPQPTILAQSTAVTVDPTFGAGKVAYRINGNTRGFALDWNLALSASTTLFIGAERQLTRSSKTLSYQGGIIRSGLVFSF